MSLKKIVLSSVAAISATMLSSCGPDYKIEYSTNLNGKQITSVEECNRNPFGPRDICQHYLDVIEKEGTRKRYESDNGLVKSVKTEQPGSVKNQIEFDIYMKLIKLAAEQKKTVDN